MVRHFLVVPLLLAIGAVAGEGHAAEAARTALFDRRTLDGWVQRNGTATYRVEDGASSGKTSEGSPNSFLCTVKEYGDFELKFEVKVDDALNSGVQIRSKSKERTGEDGRAARARPAGRDRDQRTAGFVYGEALATGWLHATRRRPRRTRLQERASGTSTASCAKGKSIKTWVNGVPSPTCVDEKTKYDDGLHRPAGSRHQAGHRTLRGGWRDLRLRRGLPSRDGPASRSGRRRAISDPGGTATDCADQVVADLYQADPGQRQERALVVAVDQRRRSRQRQRVRLPGQALAGCGRPRSSQTVVLQAAAIETVPGMLELGT